MSQGQQHANPSHSYKTTTTTKTMYGLSNCVLDVGEMIICRKILSEQRTAIAVLHISKSFSYPSSCPLWTAVSPSRTNHWHRSLGTHIQMQISRIWRLKTWVLILNINFPTTKQPDSTAKICRGRTWWKSCDQTRGLNQWRGNKLFKVKYRGIQLEVTFIMLMTYSCNFHFADVLSFCPNLNRNVSSRCFKPEEQQPITSTL